MLRNPCIRLNICLNGVGGFKISNFHFHLYDSFAKCIFESSGCKFWNFLSAFLKTFLKNAIEAIFFIFFIFFTLVSFLLFHSGTCQTEWIFFAHFHDFDQKGARSTWPPPPAWPHHDRKSDLGVDEIKCSKWPPKSPFKAKMQANGPFFGSRKKAFPPPTPVNPNDVFLNGDGSNDPFQVHPNNQGKVGLIVKVIEEG